ncbi:MAG: acyltransferase [Methyloversatilis sp.]|nr:acyltransferase [Methyloversatilis sp.]
MNYRKEIDGLRALAVVPVILFHAGFEQFSGGFVGVDVFFVISGYLITTILIVEFERGSISIAHFFERRARRILPALFVVMFVCIPLAWFMLLPHELKEFSKSLVAVSLFVSNILFWRESGYFASAADFKPLLHTWSLAVEEQYYILFPFFLIVVWRFGKNYLKAFLCIVFIISLAAAHWGSINFPTAAFFLLPTRGWELLIGVFAAFYLANSNRTEFTRLTREIGGCLGLALIIFSVFSYSRETPFPGLYAVIPTIGALLIIVFATERTRIGRFVGNRIFVGIGLVSYSAYLWHQPLFAFARIRGFTEFDPYISLGLMAGTLGVAFLSWRYIETPFRRETSINRNKLLLTGFAGTIFFIGIGLVGVLTEGFSYRYPALSALNSHSAWPNELNSTDECRAHFGGDQYCVITDVNKEPTDLLLGDSHANHFYPGISGRFEQKNRNLLMFGAGGCPPLLDIDMGYHYAHGTRLRCMERTNDEVKRLLKIDSIRNVFLSFHSETLFDSRVSFFDSRGEIYFDNDRVSAATRALVRVVKTAADNGKKVYVIEDLPDVTFSAYRRCLAQTNSAENSRPCLNLKSQNEAYFRVLENLRPHGVEIVRTHQLLISFPYSNSGVLLYRDETHLSLKGSVYVGDRLALGD